MKMRENFFQVHAGGLIGGIGGVRVEPGVARALEAQRANEQRPWRGFAFAAFALGLGTQGEAAFFAVDDVAFVFQPGKFGTQFGALGGFETEGAGELGLVQRSVIGGFEQRLDALAEIFHKVIVAGEWEMNMIFFGKKGANSQVFWFAVARLGWYLSIGM